MDVVMRVHPYSGPDIGPCPHLDGAGTIQQSKTADHHIGLSFRRLKDLGRENQSAGMNMLVRKPDSHLQSSVQLLFGKGGRTILHYERVSQLLLQRTIDNLSHIS